MYEMMAGRSPFDTVGHADNPDQNTEDYLFQSESVFYDGICKPPYSFALAIIGRKK